MIHNTYVCYPCYTIFMSHIHDTQFLGLVFIISMTFMWGSTLHNAYIFLIDNIYVWYP